MKPKLSGSIYIGIVLLFLIMFTGIGSAEKLNVDFVSQYGENTYDSASITNALMTPGEDFVSHLGGSVNNVAVSGNYAYIGEGQDVLVLDISDASKPSEIGRITTSSIVYNIEISGNYAYVADGQNGLVVLDITNPAAPAIISTYTSFTASDVAVSGNYAYLASGSRGLVALNIANPAAPIFTGMYNTSGNAKRVSISENYAYIADDSDGLVIVNVANQSALTLAGIYDTAGSASDAIVSGNYAYIADGNNGLVIVDIKNKSAPTLVGSYDTPDSAKDLSVSGNNVYVADGNDGLLVVDVTNKSAPTLVGSHSIPSTVAYSVVVSGNYAYVAYGRIGLSIIDITNPSAPTSAGLFTNTAGFANGVAISGNYAYVANGYMGLMVLNVADPTALTSAGSYITTGYAHDIALSGNYAYIADGGSGLTVLDITNPAAPTPTGSYDTSGSAFGVSVSGNYAYIADNNSGLEIVDVTNPAAPKLTGSYDTAGNAENVAISGNYAYVADGDNGLVILDITNPAAPTLVGNYDTPGHAYGIAVIGSYAYVADGKSGLIILDVTNPAAPTLVGTYDTAGSANDVEVTGNYAYIADDSNGLVIVDITNPAAPTLAGSYNTPGVGYSLTVSGNYVYVADFNNGLVILHVEATPDTTSPAPVTNLNESSAGSSWIRWTWINPKDIDFKHVMVYIDGAFVTNTSEGSYNLTGLIEGTTHTISTKTVDTSGNVNLTWVNDSAIATTLLPDTNPPASVTNLDENDADSHWINWTWTNPSDADFSHVMVSIDGKFVTSTSDKSINYYNATGLIDNDTYTISIQTVDTLGNVNTSLVNDSAIAVKLPKILSISGANITKNSITVVWAASNDTSAVEISRGDLILGNASGSTSYVDSNLTSATTYNYTLTPSNSDGLVGKAVSVSLRTKSSSSSSSGGSSGGSSSKSSSSGGGGGSASVENYANLAMKDVDSEYLRMDSNVTYRFTKEGNPIQSVSFYSLKNVGETTSTIEVLNNRSKLVNSIPEGSIYKYVNIWVGKAGFATAANIKDAQVKFKVNSSWIQQMGINMEDVKLQRYNGTAWEVLPTTMESNTTGYVIFQSPTSGFSPFAITAEKALASPENGESSQSSENGNVTSSTNGTKTPGFEALFTVAGLLAVAYLFRRN